MTKRIDINDSPCIGVWQSGCKLSSDENEAENGKPQETVNAILRPATPWRFPPTRRRQSCSSRGRHERWRHVDAVGSCTAVGEPWLPPPEPCAFSSIKIRSPKGPPADCRELAHTRHKKVHAWTSPQRLVPSGAPENLCKGKRFLHNLFTVGVEKGFVH